MRLFNILLLLLMGFAPVYAQRIVSLAPSVTEMLYAIGAGSSVVAVDRDSDYPAIVQTLPKVSGYDLRSVEAIVALNPDLVVAWQGGTPPALIRQLRQLGMRVVLVDTPTLVSVSSAMEQLGVATNHVASAKQAAELFQQQLTRLAQKYGKHPSNRTVMIEFSSDPLYVAARDSLQSQIITLCGGVNAFEALPGEAQMVSVEDVLAVHPDVIIGVTPVRLNSWLQWPALPAVKSSRLAVINADLLSRNGPRILEGAEQVCNVINL